MGILKTDLQLRCFAVSSMHYYIPSVLLMPPVNVVNYSGSVHCWLTTQVVSITEIVLTSQGEREVIFSWGFALKKGLL